MSVLGHVNYWFVILLMMVGFYILISRGNLVKKLLGLTLFQTSVFIMYISLGKIRGGTAPILLDMGHGGEDGHGASDGHAAAGTGGDASEAAASAVDHASTALDAAATAGASAGDRAADGAASLAEPAAQAAGHAAEAAGEVLYSNPLPHVLILTAIVVGIATTALGLSLVIRIRESYGTIEEDEIHAMDASL